MGAGLADTAVTGQRLWGGVEMRRLLFRRCFQREHRPRGGNCCPKGKMVLAWHTKIAAR